MVKHYKELIVWQKAMQLVKEVYTLTEKLPKKELYGLSNQMQRAVISIPSNIAEGQARNGTKEFINFLSIANGSKAELQTQLLICVDIGYVNETEIEQIMVLSEEIGKMLFSLMRKLTTNH